MAHAGDSPPDQPASGQIRTLRKDGLSSLAPETGERPPAAGPAGATGLPRTAPVETAPGLDGIPGPPPPWYTRFRRHPLAAHLLLLAGYLVTGIAVTWPRVTYLAGRLPSLRDAGGYVWDFWWVARQVSHLSSPWSTRYLAAPVGADLGYHTLMPLPGLLMTPVTLAFGPSLSYNLLSILCPGLLCYVMYRAARLWLPTQLGAIAAGGFFGLSAILTWRSWYELNLALGALFLPLALEAAVRLTRRPGRRQAIILGVVMGAAILTDQESAVLAGIVAGLVLVPWLARHPTAARLRAAALAAVTGLIVASPQLIVMFQQASARPDGRGPGGAARGELRALGRLAAGNVRAVPPGGRLRPDRGERVLPPWPVQHRDRLVRHHPHRAGPVRDRGVVAAAARALAGPALGGLRRPVDGLGAVGRQPFLRAGGLGGARGPDLDDHAVHLVHADPRARHLPGGQPVHRAGPGPLVLLAGSAVEWLRKHTGAGVIPVLVLALLETGWSGNPGIGSMPTSLPALDGPIAAQHTQSIVVDVPFGIRGGMPVIGDGFAPESMVLATADGHPLADALISRIPADTINGIEASPFYAALLSAQGGKHRTTNAEFRAAKLSAREMNIGWVLVWRRDPHLLRLLRLSGFRQAYQADGVLVYRPARDVPPAAHGSRPLAGG